jgi:hypothetical protein
LEKNGDALWFGIFLQEGREGTEEEALGDFEDWDRRRESRFLKPSVSSVSSCKKPLH